MVDLNEIAEQVRKSEFSKISRVEVIGPDGREYVRYFESEEWMNYMIQDEGRTLKIFIEDCK